MNSHHRIRNCLVCCGWNCFNDLRWCDITMVNQHCFAGVDGYAAGPPRARVALSLHSKEFIEHCEVLQHKSAWRATAKVV